ncbi:competence protein ComEC [Jatrophihabitans sp. GAS493]|nr:competence protein ComEC [Jatrophihabitans sp. GAS493]
MPGFGAPGPDDAGLASFGLRGFGASGVDTALRRVLRGADGEQTPPVDLRLAVGAAAAWVATLIGLGCSPATVAKLAAAALFVAGLAAWLARHRVVAGHDQHEDLTIRVSCGVALVGAVLLLTLAPLSARMERVRQSPVTSLAAAHTAVTAQLRITGDPHPLAGAGVGGGGPRVIVDATLLSIRVGTSQVAARGAVLVFGAAADWAQLLPGQRIRLDARLQPARGDPLRVAALVGESAPTLLGHPPWWQRAAGVVRSSLRDASAGLPTSVRGLLPGLVDGDTSQLDPILAEHFRVAGLTHLVAVSGTNCSILVGAALLVMRRFRLGPVTTAFISAVVLAGFVVIARPSPSVLRAAVMGVIVLVALALGRPRAALPTLSAAVLLLLLYQPDLANDVGFTLSVIATAALVLLSPRWAQALRRRHVPPVLAEAIAVASAAHVVTAPVIAAMTGHISVVAIPANVLAEPVVSMATIVGFAAALTAPISLGLGATLAQLAGWPCRWLVWVADFFGGLDGASLPWPAGAVGAMLLVCAAAGAVALARHGLLRRMLIAATVVGLLVQLPVRSAVAGWPAVSSVLVACDVGQGDGLVLPTAPGRAIVVDTGPEPVAMDRCLHDLGITDIPLVVLTHFHLDHIGGLAGVFHDRRVAAVVTGPLDEPQSGVEQVQKTLDAHGLTLGRAQPGESFADGAVLLQVLGPPTAYRGTRSDPNNSSLVMRATVAGKRILLMGDAEVEAQQALLDDHVDLTADILKVAHHGSAYSVPALLAAVHAKVAIISVGAHNDYGLPSAVLLSELQRLSIPILRTDQDGDIAVTVTNGQLKTVIRGVAASEAA